MTTPRTSQNGWPAPPRRRRTWIVPGTGRHLVLEDGPAGFLLVHLALWFHERIEAIDVGEWDDWGYNFRPIRGATITLSNHSSGTAVDLNATRHPLGVRGSIKDLLLVARIHVRLAFYRRLIAWGGDWHGRADEMHWEIVGTRAKVARLAARLLTSPRGRRIIEANPGAAQVVRLADEYARAVA